MKERDHYHKHSWRVLRRARHGAGGYSEVEYCTQCNARREVLHPFGVVTSSDPIPVPKYCPAGTGRERILP